VNPRPHQPMEIARVGRPRVDLQRLTLAALGDGRAETPTTCEGERRESLPGNCLTKSDRVDEAGEDFTSSTYLRGLSF
jgi:hypothetical protein